jgi:hypothetical protein
MGTKDLYLNPLYVTEMKPTLRTPQEKTYKGHKTGSELLNIFLTGTKL